MGQVLIITGFPIHFQNVFPGQMYFNHTLSHIIFHYTGRVQIQSSPDSQEPILYNYNNTSITCSSPENLGKPTWWFQQNAQFQQEVTNGTEATVFYESDRNSTISIKRTTEVWKGKLLKQNA